MSYFFPHQTRDEKKEETVQLFTKYLAVSCDILEDVSRQIITETPLLKELIALPVEGGKVEWTYKQWRSVCVKNGWKQVDSKWLQNISDASTSDTFKEWIKNEKHIYTKGEQTISYDKDLSNWWHWHWWNRTVQSWDNRLQLIKDASFDLQFLEWYDDKIYSHEAFLILMGISSDKLDRKEFRIWFIETAPQRFIDYPQIKEYGLKENYTEFDEWKRIKRRFGKGTTELHFEIDTQDFIKWAIKCGDIEEDTSHYRDGRKAPYEESFSKMLHKELLANDLIKECRQEDEWTWNIKPTNGANSFNYLGRLLALNRVPIKYWLPYEKHSVSWQNLQHYIVGVKNPQKHTTLPANAITIENIVKKLLEEHDERPFTEYRDLEE
tara:strand:- start:297 stop:1436 length:1140 start_codon:yes stop_codon:yes gene_type:complete